MTFAYLMSSFLQSETLTWSLTYKFLWNDLRKLGTLIYLLSAFRNTFQIFYLKQQNFCHKTFYNAVGSCFNLLNNKSLPQNMKQ